MKLQKREVQDSQTPPRFLPVKMMIITTAKMSGYLASTPGASIVMYFLQNSSMCWPMISSNVALQALATLEVPVRGQKGRGSPSAAAKHPKHKALRAAFGHRQVSKSTTVPEGSRVFRAQVLAAFPLQTQPIAA